MSNRLNLCNDVLVNIADFANSKKECDTMCIINECNCRCGSDLLLLNRELNQLISNHNNYIWFIRVNDVCIKMMKNLREISMFGVESISKDYIKFITETQQRNIFSNSINWRQLYSQIVSGVKNAYIFRFKFNEIVLGKMSSSSVSSYRNRDIVRGISPMNMYAIDYDRSFHLEMSYFRDIPALQYSSNRLRPDSDDELMPDLEDISDDELDEIS